MPLHAELLERRMRGDQTTLFFRLYDDDPEVGELGDVEIPDGPPSEIKPALRREANRLQQLPVGKIVDL